MERTVCELKSKQKIMETYGIYKLCMFQPTEEKFSRKADGFLQDDAVKAYACLQNGETKAVIVLRTEAAQAEILGIAVAEAAQRQGVGSYLIKQLVQDLALTSLYAETDDDAVDFYRKNSFFVTEFTETYDGKAVRRYRCQWNRS